MKKHTIKLDLTTDNDEVALEGEPRLISSPSPDPGDFNCNSGYAIYAYDQTRKMWRVGGAWCQDPASGYSPASAAASVNISSSCSNAFLAIVQANSGMQQLRVAVCCPVGSNDLLQ